MAASITITSHSTGDTIPYDDSTGNNGVTLEFDINPDGRTDLEYRVEVRRDDGTVLVKADNVSVNSSGTFSETFAVDGGQNIDFVANLQDTSDNFIDDDIVTVSFDEPQVPTLNVSDSPSGTYTVSSGSTASVDWTFDIEDDGTVVDGDWDISVDSTTEFSGTYDKDTISGRNRTESYGEGSYSWTVTVETNEYYYDGFKTQSTSDSGSFTVEESSPASFSVTIDSTNSPVNEGDTLNVDYTVTNTGDESGAGDVNLDVAGSQRDSHSFDLPGGSSATGELSWTTGTGDEGSYTATVSTDSSYSDDSDTASVEVNDVQISNILTPTSGDITTANNLTEFKAEYDVPTDTDITVEGTATEASSNNTVTVFSGISFQSGDSVRTETVSAFQDLSPSSFEHTDSDGDAYAEYSWNTIVYDSNGNEIDSYVTGFFRVYDDIKGLPQGYHYFPNNGNAESELPIYKTTSLVSASEGSRCVNGSIVIPDNISKYENLTLKVFDGSTDADATYEIRGVLQSRGPHDHGQKGGEVFAEFTQAFTRSSESKDYQDKRGNEISVAVGDPLPAGINTEHYQEDVPDTEDPVTVNQLDNDSLVYTKKQPTLTEVEVFVNGTSVGVYTVDADNPLTDLDIKDELVTPGSNDIRIEPVDGKAKLRGNVTIDHVLQTGD